MKKVLIITYYWPPAGGPGVHRIVRFVKYLPDFGWQPIILTVANPTSPSIDNSLESEIPDVCKIYRTKAFEPFTIYKIFTGKNKTDNIPKDIIVKKEKDSFKEKVARLIRANIFVPDARLGWIPYIIKEGKKIIKKENPSVIFSTSPPHSLQIGAKKLAKKTGLHWVADFRDPWSEAYWESDIEKIKIIKMFNSHLEKKVLRNANTITTVSEGIAELLYKKIPNKFSVLYNGYEGLNKEKVTSSKFKILFIGNLSKYQTPHSFLEAVNLLPREIQTQLEIIFVGKVFDDFKTTFKKYDHIKIIEKQYMPYKQLMEFSKSASLLLLIYHKTSYILGYMTAKIYDYLALRKPILALGQKGGVGEKVLSETESGILFNYDEIDSISQFILSQYREWEKDKYILLDENESLKKYSTQENVKKLVDIFNRRGSWQN